MGEWDKLRKTPEGEKVWVSLLTGEAYNNTLMIATQILSVQKYSKHKHVTMVLPDVGDETRDHLQNLGSTVT